MWEDVDGVMAYLVVSVAIVGLLWFQIPQHDDPRLKSNYKLKRRSNRQSVRWQWTERTELVTGGEESNTFDIHKQRESKSGISRRLRAWGRRELGRHERENQGQVQVFRFTNIHLRTKIHNRTVLILKKYETKKCVYFKSIHIIFICTAPPAGLYLTM